MHVPSFSDSEQLRTALWHFTLAILVTGLLTTAGCDSSNPEYTLSGEVINSTDRGVENAEVELSKDGSSAQTTTTNDTGYFEVSGLSGGDYEVSVTADGYRETSTTTSVNSNKTLEDLSLLGSANISGTISNATTGDGLEQAEVAFTFGGENADTSRSEADLITTTDSDGNYTISDAPTGTFVCVVRAPGFFPAVIPNIDVEEGENDLGQASSSETLEEGEVRIVLSWGETPDDLDSHLTGPSSDGDRFHVAYFNQNPTDAGANLDVDDTDSFGPETITITNFRSGTYRYSVHNFANQSDDGAVGIEDSPAQITVYDSNGQRATYSPPPASDGDGNTWRVLEIDGGSLTFDDNGGDTFGYYFADSDSDTSVFSRPEKGEKQAPSNAEAFLRLFDRPVDSF